MQGIHGYIFERVIIETLINKDQNVRHVSQIDKDKAMDKISIRFSQIDVADNAAYI